MEKRIYFIRHGESINNLLEIQDPATYFYTRVKDPELSERGIAQCLELKEKLQGLEFDKIISSPMLRCLETSSLLFGDRELMIEVRPEFYELGGMWNLHEVFKGMGKTEILERFPQVDAGKIGDDGYYFLDHMETHEECEERVRRLLDILLEYKESSIAVVVHGLLMQKLASEVITRQGTNRNPHSAIRPPQKNCGITLISHRNSSFTLLSEFT